MGLLHKFLRTLRALCAIPLVRRGVLVGAAAYALFAAYSYLPLIRIGEPAVTFSAADVFRYYAADAEIAAIVGAPPMPDRKSAFAFLALAGMERQILAARDIHVVRDNAIAVVEARSVVKGTVAKLRTSLGVDRYFRLFIEPLVVSELFVNYYRSADPGRKQAAEFLTKAQGAGLAEAARQAGLKVQEMAIPASGASAAFAADARGAVGRLYGKFLEDNAGYLVVVVREVRADAVLVDGVFFKRQPLIEFVASELKSGGIAVDYKAYSPWGEQDILEVVGGDSADKN